MSKLDSAKFVSGEPGNGSRPVGMDVPKVCTGASAPWAAAGMAQRGVESTGSIVRFVLQVLREVPTAIRLYPSEIFRQAGLLVRSNALVVLFVMLMFGALMALTIRFSFMALGIESYLGGGQAFVTRGVAQVVFGWVVAAKVGCGIVAELGAMRISDEIDAMEVMGVRSLTYLASTRVAATLIVIPFLWIAGMSLEFFFGYLVNVPLLDTVSQGGFVYILFQFQNTADFTFAVIWATVIAVIIVLVACYYGFTAKGGPVGVGRNTAQSMLLNLVLISLTAMVLVQLFYGNSPNVPIGN